jgi:hypothetical protein
MDGYWMEPANMPPASDVTDTRRPRQVDSEKITINLGPDPRDARTIEATTTEIEDATPIEH